MTIPSSSMRKFFTLKTKPNFFSQESGMLFRLSSLDIPDLIDCFANQKKNNKIIVEFTDSGIGIKKTEFKKI